MRVWEKKVRGVGGLLSVCGVYGWVGVWVWVWVGGIYGLPDIVVPSLTAITHLPHPNHVSISLPIHPQMYTECQELLQLFGLPYIIAPTEAEAQCAYLERQGLVDAVITDDNDVFLFGAETVFRRLFQERQWVEEYRMSDVSRELGLTRDDLVRMALLLGSDYTEGVQGVGIVNAVEVLRAFPGDEGLAKFKEWMRGPDEEVLELAGVGGEGEGEWWGWLVGVDGEGE